MKKEDLIPGHLYYHNNGSEFIIEYKGIAKSVSVSRYLRLDLPKHVWGPSDNFTDLGSIERFKELTPEQLNLWKTAIGEPIDHEPLLYN